MKSESQNRIFEAVKISSLDIGQVFYFYPFGGLPQTVMDKGYIYNHNHDLFGVMFSPGLKALGRLIDNFDASQADKIVYIQI